MSEEFKRFTKAAEDAGFKVVNLEEAVKPQWQHLTGDFYLVRSEEGMVPACEHFFERWSEENDEPMVVPDDVYRASHDYPILCHFNAEERGLYDCKEVTCDAVSLDKVKQAADKF